MNPYFLILLGLITSQAYAAEALPAEHIAGYEWARDNGIEDEESCKTESPDFNAGCLSFIEQSKTPSLEPADDITFDMPEGFDFPDDEFTILE